MNFSERIPVISQKLAQPEDTYIDAYLEGNLRLPQSNLGMAVTVARTLVNDPNMDISSFLETSLSPQHVSRLKAAMNSAHTAHRVDFFTETEAARRREVGADIPAHREVPDKRFQELWSDVQGGTVLLIAAALGFKGATKTDDEGIDPEKRGGTLLPYVQFINEKLQDPQNRAYVKMLTGSFQKTLLSERGRELAKEWRDSVGFRYKPRPLDDEERTQREYDSLDVRREMTNILMRDADAAGLEVNDETEKFLTRL